MNEIFAVILSLGLSFLVYEEENEPMTPEDGPIRIFVGMRPYGGNPRIIASGKDLPSAVADLETCTKANLEALVVDHGNKLPY